MQKGILLPVFYLGSLEYYSKIKHHSDNITLEACEHYPKQTNRNRTIIHSANGKLNLTVPVKSGSNVHTKMKDVRISYDANWQRLHWRSIQTSYRSSSFFEYYEDDFAPFFHTQTEFLFDFNIELMQLCLKLLNLKPHISVTTEYVKDVEGLEDYRNAIKSNRQSDSYNLKPYFQVFEDKNGFIPNLSIIDLLFNQGPQSKQFL
ncbi:WbqC family protein [Albibacterium sp.]|uniref:WbqC family protein n=1 Tax=Albibacterium sp. TaxID=2952885 RepID=UPI002BF00DB1|nr:WbqC family protein [Albibacterium sp.]HUH19710.1 WbqC family protein [Albibacterium sp.]